jgi:hypothetical protein
MGTFHQSELIIYAHVRLITIYTKLIFHRILSSTQESNHENGLEQVWISNRLTRSFSRRSDFHIKDVEMHWNLLNWYMSQSSPIVFVSILAWFAKWYLSHVSFHSLPAPSGSSQQKRIKSSQHGNLSRSNFLAIKSYSSWSALYLCILLLWFGLVDLKYAVGV